MEFAIIAAVDEEGGIGKDNGLPWHLPKDLGHFSETTHEGIVIMGRKTWESLPPRFKPLPNRLNIVVTSNRDYQIPQGVLLADSLDAALDLAEKEERDTFVIGGASLFKEAIDHPKCTRLILTKIYKGYDCDAFFPNISERFVKELPEGFSLFSPASVQHENGVDFEFEYYRSK